MCYYTAFFFAPSKQSLSWERLVRDQNQPEVPPVKLSIQRPANFKLNHLGAHILAVPGQSPRREVMGRAQTSIGGARSHDQPATFLQHRRYNATLGLGATISIAGGSMWIYGWPGRERSRLRGLCLMSCEVGADKN